MATEQIENEARPAHVIAYHALQNALDTLTALIPNNGNDSDWHYAVVLTDLRKTVAYFNTYIFIPAQGSVPKEE